MVEDNNRTFDWKAFVFEQAGESEERITGTRLYKAVQEKANQEGIAAPGPRTVDRYLSDFRNKLSERERRQYEFVRWPETFEAEVLPWEAAAPYLESLGVLPRRPNVRSARWLWKVTASIPHSPLSDRVLIAGHLAAWEAKGELQSVIRDYEAIMARLSAGQSVADQSFPPLRFLSSDPAFAQIMRSMPHVHMSSEALRLAGFEEVEEDEDHELT